MIDQKAQRDRMLLRTRAQRRLSKKVAPRVAQRKEIKPSPLSPEELEPLEEECIVEEPTEALRKLMSRREH